MDLLDIKLMKLFILAEGVEDFTQRYEYDDLLYALIDEVKSIKPIYEELREKILEMA